MYTFIWAINGKSLWANNEVRYSIKSVEKYHPGANIIIIGEKPDFYTGKFIQHTDVDSSPYINKWKKIIRLCQLDETPDQFVVMDDDFFLLAPLAKKHFSDSNTFHDKVNNITIHSHWLSALRNTKLLVPENQKNYCTHSPFWIDKKSFLEFITKYDWDIPPGLVLRQLYISYLNGSIFEIEELKHDIKIKTPGEIRNCDYFFSTYDDLVQSGFHHTLKHLYGSIK